MEGVAQEKVPSNTTYFKMFNTTAEIAKYDVQLSLNGPNIWYEGNKVETDVLGDIASIIGTKSEVKFIPSSLKYDNMIKDNTEKYKDLLRDQSGLMEAMLEHDISEST
eukprot:699710-Ditylum_brightwellii.AAC.1